MLHVFGAGYTKCYIKGVGEGGTNMLPSELIHVNEFYYRNYWSVGRWEDAAILSCFLTLVYMTLQAPHIVHNSNSFSHCFAHSVHKFCVMFVMLFALVYFRHY